MMEKHPLPHNAPPYEPPRIVQRGRLKQFAGSPLSPEPNDPLDILGLGD